MCLNVCVLGVVDWLNCGFVGSGGNVGEQIRWNRSKMYKVLNDVVCFHIPNINYQR